MKALRLILLVLCVFCISAIADEIQTNYVLVIAGTDNYLLPTARDIYYLSNNIADPENIYWIDSSDSLRIIVNNKLSKVDEDDLVLIFMIGHGKGYASDPQNGNYGFSAVKPIISEKELIGFGKSRQENQIIWQGPRINRAYPRPRCVGLNKKDFFFRSIKGTQTFEGYGIKFVADVNKLELADGTIVDDHSNWVKVIYYYAKCDFDQDTFFQQEVFSTNNDDKLDGQDISDVAFKVDTLYSSYAYGEYNIDNVRTEDYMFIVRTDSGPRIAVSLNHNNDDFSEMPIHGIVSEDGYIHSLDFNQDGDYEDYLYFNEQYQIGKEFIADYELAKLFFSVSGKKALFAGNCYSGGFHDVFSGFQIGTYASTSDGATALALTYEEGYIKVLELNNNYFSGGREKITLADLYNAGYQNIRNRCRHEFWSKVCYSNWPDQNFIYGPVVDSNNFSSTIIAYADGRETVSSVEDKKIVSLPTQTILSQNYPNPFNPKTSINYSIAKAGHVKVMIYNMLGQKILTLVDENKTAGNYSVNFNAENLESGIYFYRLQTDNYIKSKRMVLMK